MTGGIKKLAILILIVCLFAGCAQQEVKQTPQEETKQEAKQEVIKVGVIGPMDLPFGIAEKKAVELAAEQINAEGGILGKKVEVIVADTKLNPNTATSEFRRLVDEECSVIIGGFASGVSLSMQEVMAETKTVWLADGSSPKLTEKVKEDYEHYKYFFRAGTLNGTTFAYDIFDALHNYYNGKLGKNWKKVAVIRDDAVWTEGVMAALRPMLESNGYEIVMDAKVPKGTEDFSSILYEAKDKADVIVTLLAHVNGIPLVKQWSEMRIPLQIIGHDLSAIYPTAWESSNGKIEGEVFIATGGAIHIPVNERAEKFIEAWKEKYGSLPDANTAYDMYDALFIYKAAVEQAAKDGKDPNDPDVVVEYIEKFNADNPFECVRGKLAFTKYHDPMWGDEYIRNWICQWQDGKVVIIWPENVATGEYVQPEWIE
ncbi:ABC transporter substrate-binding protein [Archaeoglobus veneficus]|uniref:Extracellular ligand-binding receptor n=1 Tax=Archaeoglobus veneficus (strain DSM 11195 / SNP6) TaxID=693661 RepID=F2KMR4_ARCVS|nr:ABC transporter substrate-binding protein [Archaeoglobus veneficus]AEA46088.1 Extracellular ligand-binding receptor [Archaeoglobus veneficus SNP6]